MESSMVEKSQVLPLPLHHIAKKQPEFKKWEELALQGGDTGLADLLLHGRRGGALPTNRHQVPKYTWTFQPFNMNRIR